MSKFREVWGPRRDDERGATMVFTAICMVLLLWSGAMGVDIGFSVWGARSAQAMADTAALDVARYVSIADQSSSPAPVTYLNGKLANVLTDNGSSASLTETPGLWRNNTWTAEGNNCAPTNPPAAYPCNAIMVTAAQTVPQIFSGGFHILGAHSGQTIAAETPEVGFSVGSYLATLSTNSADVPVLNTIMSVLGTQATLTAVGYQGLDNTYVTASQLITASGGLLTASNLMSTALTASQWLAIWQDAVGNQEASLSCGASPEPSACVAATSLGDLDFSSSSSARLCDLVAINGANCTSGTLTTADLAASLNVFQMLSTEAELANGSNGLNVTNDLNLTVAGVSLTNVDLYLDVVQPAQVAYGPTGTTAQTAQVSSNLTMAVNVAGLGNLGVLSLPLSAASATSTLSTITCQNNAMFSTKINTTTTAASGAVTLAGVNVATLNVNGVSSTGSSFGGSVVPPTAATASASPPTNPRNVGTSSPTLSFSGLLGSLNAGVGGLLSSTSVLAEAYGPVLQAVGVQAAGAQVADLSTNCDAVSLVQ